mgnify:CR=1 FL=1
MIPLDSLIKYEGESFDYAGVSIMTSSYFTFITDASRNHTKSILLEIGKSDGDNSETIKAYLLAIFFAVDPQMSKDLYNVIMTELIEGTSRGNRAAISTYNGINYFAFLNAESTTFMIAPENHLE